MGPEWGYEIDANRLDRISTHLGNSFFPLVEVEAKASGYTYEEALQPYHVEVWAETTTMNDILVPLCSSLGANYVSGAGYQSITAMVSLLRERVAQLEKPCRVLYVSDYDDQGTPTHDHAGTLRDQDAPAFGEQLRELL